MSPELTFNFLQDTYIKQKLSTWTIGKKFKIARSTVYTALKKHKIPIRTIAQAHVRYARAPFSGNLYEKAYLLGFSIGDLRVRNHNGVKSDTISIACGSTKPAQIKLIRELFSKYGRVWQGRPDRRGAVNSEAYVDSSFAFLLPRKRQYAWCIKNKRHFFSFLAGFTDAEGSFYLARNQAFVAWGNYNEKLLKFIRKGLARYGIEVPPVHSDALKGYVGSHGYVRRQNYNHLVCSKKAMVRVLLDQLEPFLRHTARLKRLVLLRKNLMMRS
jgi:hypothetical protein